MFNDDVIIGVTHEHVRYFRFLPHSYLLDAAIHHLLDSGMSAATTHAFRLARLFTPTYAARVNAQIVHPAAATVVKPTELISALARPLHVYACQPQTVVVSNYESIVQHMNLIKTLLS